MGHTGWAPGRMPPVSLLPTGAVFPRLNAFAVRPSAPQSGIGEKHVYAVGPTLTNSQCERMRTCTVSHRIKAISYPSYGTCAECNSKPNYNSIFLCYSYFFCLSAELLHAHLATILAIAQLPSHASKARKAPSEIHHRNTLADMLCLLRHRLCRRRDEAQTCLMLLQQDWDQSGFSGIPSESELWTETAACFWAGQCRHYATQLVQAVLTCIFAKMIKCCKHRRAEDLERHYKTWQ